MTNLAPVPPPLDAAVDNISRLILDALTSQRRTRFAEVIRYARIASQLLRAGGGSVADFDDIEDVVMPGDVIMPGPPRRIPPGNDMADVLREMVGPIATMNANTNRQNEARAAASELDELNMILVRLEPGLPDEPDRLSPTHRKVLQERADLLTAKMEKRNAVLRAELLRGHPADVAGQGHDDRQGEQGIANGEGGTHLPTGEVVLDP